MNDKRAELVTKLKSMFAEEIKNFRENELNKQRLSEFDRDTIIKACIVEAADEYIKRENAFNTKDLINGKYILWDRHLEILAGNGHLLNQIYKVFEDEEARLYNPAVFTTINILRTIDIFDEILFDKAQKGNKSNED